MERRLNFRAGIDENGLGARLGPLVVTGVLARVTEQGDRLLSRKPPRRLRDDLGDSKELVSHGDVALGEAWARALGRGPARSPAEIVASLCLESEEELRSPCPSHVAAQCWSAEAEKFVAEDSDVERIRGHLRFWAERGVEIVSVTSSVVCTKRLNDAKGSGGNRFVSDLHAMERLVLSFRRTAGEDLVAVCGKVGGIEDYSRFFGPLSHGLHAELGRSRAKSAYLFPNVGEVRFVRDADAKDCLVMLASIVGKWAREVLMARIATHYRGTDPESVSVSGYHDPVTARFVDETALLRKKRRVPDDCFERARDAR
ncbi:MAG TPA: hypothetical protein VHE30_12935 [Polyangiaceae bacterium]|nr:hypothetical protein [Polyangiaceae bacterium]